MNDDLVVVLLFIFIIFIIFVYVINMPDPKCNGNCEQGRDCDCGERK